MLPQSRLTDAFLMLAIIIMTGWLLHVGRDLLAPIVGAILCVFVINGLSTGLGKIPQLSRLPIWARDVIAAALISLLLVEGVLLIVNNISDLAIRAPAYQISLEEMTRQVAELLHLDQDQVLQSFQAETVRLLHVPTLVRIVAGSVLGIVAVLFFVILNIVFLMVERHDFNEKVDLLGFSTSSLRRVRAVITDVNSRVSQYLALQTFLNIVLGILSWAIMATFGLEFAVIFGIVIAVLNYIPYIGSFIGVAFPLLAAVLQFDGIGNVIWLGVLLSLAQFLIGNIVSPRIMGYSLNLSPWIILVGLTFWAGLWGWAGAVFSVPIMAVLVVILGEFDSTRPAAVLMSRKGELGNPGVRETPLSDKTGDVN